MAEADLMRGLHDAYVWKVNAAVERVGWTSSGSSRTSTRTRRSS